MQIFGTTQTGIPLWAHQWWVIFGTELGENKIKLSNLGTIPKSGWPQKFWTESVKTEWCIIGSDKPSLKVSTAGVREGQGRPGGTSQGYRPWIQRFTRRQGRSFRSGTSLNFTEPDDDDDRVMAKGNRLKSGRLIIRS